MVDVMHGGYGSVTKVDAMNYSLHGVRSYILCARCSHYRQHGEVICEPETRIYHAWSFKMHACLMQREVAFKDGHKRGVRGIRRCVTEDA